MVVVKKCTQQLSQSQAEVCKFNKERLIWLEIVLWLGFVGKANLEYTQTQTQKHSQKSNLMLL